MIVSVGASYTGLERLVLAADVRYIDFADANGFGRRGFSPDGALRGLGWRSIVAAAAGVQYQLTPGLSLRLGYSWNENPIPDNQAFVSTPAPTITEHILTAGVSWKVTDDFVLSVAYGHGFENAIEGPLVTPAGLVPGTSVRNSTSGDFVVVGASLKFGPSAAPRSSEAY
jgi:long-chain fatty acid transport protein